MKNITLTLFAIMLFTIAKGQGFEWSVNANSGLYKYVGSDAASTTFFNGVTAGMKQGYPNNPYGGQFGFSYGAALQGQLNFKSGFFIGLQAGFDLLRSKSDVNSVHPQYLILAPGPLEPYDIAVTGHSYLISQDINLNPFIGMRFNIQKVKLDISGGLDFAFNTGTNQSGSAKDANGNYYQTGSYWGTLPADVRLRLGLAAWYKKFALQVSYAHGLPNLVPFQASSGAAAGSSQSGSVTAQSELIRFGLAYRLK